MVDVLIPVYNSANSIKAAINSCLIQKEVSKFIVVDDCSSDDTLKTLKLNFGNNSKVQIVERYIIEFSSTEFFPLSFLLGSRYYSLPDLKSIYFNFFTKNPF